MSSYPNKKKEAAAAAKKRGIPEKDVNLPKIPISNALIAFTSKGLQTIQAGLQKTSSLRLDRVEDTDPAFFNGMGSKSVRDALSDPDRDTWDPLFNSTEIHGILKIGGSSKNEVEKHLKNIQVILKHGTAIDDVFQNSPPTPTDSRVDGWTRPNDRGKEHFGFEDGISQPRMNGIDELEPEPANGGVNMNTDPKLLIVTEQTSSEEGGVERPKWMYDGSFLVFRKLEQNVKAFEDLTDQWQTKKCESKAHMGAKLMGRWQSGAPLAIPEFHTEDSKNPDAAKLINNFTYADEICPVSAHIRKTNLREPSDDNNSDPRLPRTRIIRNGIPYGSDYKGHETDGSTRGLLFACYQGHIEDGFQHMQGGWSNNPKFPTGDTGLDPIIGQVDQTSKGVNGKLTTFFTDKLNGKQSVEFQQLVTLKGGEYFFVPSISALRDDLAKT